MKRAKAHEFVEARVGTLWSGCAAARSSRRVDVRFQGNACCKIQTRVVPLSLTDPGLILLLIVFVENGGKNR